VPLEEEKLELKAQALLLAIFETLAIFGVSWKLYT
jgi:hypothetical protein